MSMESDSFVCSCTSRGIGYNNVIDTQHIRLKFLEFCPCSVAEIDEIGLLKFILQAYDVDSQPHNFEEWMYITLVQDEAQRRIEYLEALEQPRPCYRGRYKLIELEKLDSVRRNLANEFEKCEDVDGINANGACSDAFIEHNSYSKDCDLDDTIPLEFYDDVPEWSKFLRCNSSLACNTDSDCGNALIEDISSSSKDCDLDDTISHSSKDCNLDDTISHSSKDCDLDDTIPLEFYDDVPEWLELLR